MASSATRASLILFKLELEAVKSVRDEFDNVQIMLPFVRTTWELEECLKIMTEAGTRNGGSEQIKPRFFCKVALIYYALCIQLLYVLLSEPYTAIKATVHIYSTMAEALQSVLLEID